MQIIFVIIAAAVVSFVLSIVYDRKREYSAEDLRLNMIKQGDKMVFQVNLWIWQTRKYRMLLDSYPQGKIIECNGYEYETVGMTETLTTYCLSRCLTYDTIPANQRMIANHFQQNIDIRDSKDFSIQLTQSIIKEILDNADDEITKSNGLSKDDRDTLHEFISDLRKNEASSYTKSKFVKVSDIVKKCEPYLSCVASLLSAISSFM